MCDTLCAPGPRGMVFAKNSDRPPGEVQIAWPFGRRSSAGCTLRTQYLSIGDTGAHAALLSCPTWLWGAEHGVNEHGVAIGNERVSTTHDAAAAKPALIGMDLVRLGLERARTAAEAVDVITGLLETYGQGGIADAAHQEAYDSSFLIADPVRGLRARDGGLGLRGRPLLRRRGHLQSHHARHRLDRASDGCDGEDFDRSATRGGHGLRRRPPGGQPPFPRRRPVPAGSRAAATAAHLRDHGTGPWGAPGIDGPVDEPPPAGPARTAAASPSACTSAGSASRPPP